MKIGIVTFHAALNFGSALQAFALQTVLTEQGHDAVIIDCILESDMVKYQLFRWQIYLQRPQAFIRDLLYLSRNWKRKKAFEQFYGEYMKLSEQRYYIGRSDMRQLNSEYDAFICGSDQIWNLNCMDRLAPDFFLAFVNDGKKKIAYGPSMPSPVREIYYNELKKHIERLDHVSVREAQTVGYLTNEVGVQKEIAHVVDPTFLLDARTYIDGLRLAPKTEKYIFVYILLEEDFSDLLNEVIELSKTTGLKIKYVYDKRLPQLRGNDYVFGIGPIEFLDAIYNASYVITNSFHATVFSIHFQVPFCVFPRSGSQSRMTELLYSLDMVDNLYRKGDRKWMDSKANQHTISKLESFRKSSLDFLKKSLEEHG